MAKSKAQKRRAHLVRNGRRDPAQNRGTTPSFSTHERRTPTRAERLQKQEQKHRRELQRLY